MSANGRVDSPHMRQVGLSFPEVKILTFVAQSAGEILWKPEYAKPESRAFVDKLLQKQLVESISRDGRGYLRLTDQGRSVAAQLDAMMVAPKVEVASG